ncbi:MAG: amidophosphoribosyltransferase [Candidatus Liptonbacteria bacterium RIFCSPHIGHO2_01_FULL_57_28]|uniref:Amidophosphoribosyltransferase n=1 Tax=Candidatus Liptonbacteria bacterium RIFCSPHIGHO2_01_FULL_57_28 TaxID=1798647 RepID=A0A1G2C8Y3_9BACT|nr:MAG: amidophosphoribosyltransferase [Candidatus Liptonbacteria bacterium RIFCSPHIGHO2_01_FULL_57_28]
MATVQEKCGIFGVYGEGLDVSRLSFFGLFALQHRGQENSGIAASNGKTLRAHKGAGLVTQVYTEEVVKDLPGYIAIGHNRYSTFGGTSLGHTQPVVVDPILGLGKGKGITVADGLLAFAHNGNLPSVRALIEFLEKKGIDHVNLSDSEMMAEAIGQYVRSGKSLPDAVQLAHPLFTGAFSALAMTKDTLVAVRDTCGIRPLAIGKLNGGFVFASETCAFHAIGVEFVREVNPGEMVVVDKQGLRSVQVAPATPKVDIFEFVYFARPDSIISGRSVYEVRRNFGLRLAREFPIEADVVVPVPETAIPVATAYANALGLPFEMGLVKNRYIHRTFIQPEQHSRDLGVKMKLTPLPEVLAGKRVIIMDDSIVRGTTSRQIVKMIFEAGAKEVHFLVSSPPVRYPDFYGIDIPRQDDLIASRKSVEEIRDFLGATSLHYLSLDGMVAATGLPADRFSTSCFTGEYPIDLHERVRDFTVPAAAALA